MKTNLTNTKNKKHSTTHQPWGFTGHQTFDIKFPYPYSYNHLKNNKHPINKQNDYYIITIVIYILNLLELTYIKPQHNLLISL